MTTDKPPTKREAELLQSFALRMWALAGDDDWMRAHHLTDLAAWIEEQVKPPTPTHAADVEAAYREGWNDAQAEAYDEELDWLASKALAVLGV